MTIWRLTVQGEVAYFVRKDDAVATVKATYSKVGIPEFKLESVFVYERETHL